MLISGGIASLPMEWVGPVVAIGVGVVILVAAWTGSHAAP
jgi:hypothetical protein